MDKPKVYFYPSCPREGYTNPYCINYKQILKKEFTLLDAENKVTPMKTATLFRYSLVEDMVILNWIENVGKLRLGIVQFFLAYLSLTILKLRKKDIIWMFHNMTPHEGRDYSSDILCSFLYKNATLVISHSQEAAEYVRKHAQCRVEYICHPIKALDFTFRNDLKQYDVLIWGTILPYKGIVEFLENCKDKTDDVSILILGKCSDESLCKQIEQLCGKWVTFENRMAEFDELASYIKKCKYVLFPYIGNSISSSGALIDTLAMKGNPIGPAKGAFMDLSKEGVCITYRNYDELIGILRSSTLKISEERRELFINSNSWVVFGKKLKQLLKNLS